MTTNETTAPGCSPNAARDSRKTLAGSYRKAAPHSTRHRPPPVWAEAILEIPRGEKTRLRVELVQWSDGDELVAQFVTLVLGVNGVWFPAPHRTSLRMNELARVAEALLEVAE